MTEPTDEQVRVALWVYNGKPFPSKKKLRRMRAALVAAGAQAPWPAPGTSQTAPDPEGSRAGGR